MPFVHPGGLDFDEFYNFPFLRDQFFISYFQRLQARAQTQAPSTNDLNHKKFESLILKSQIEYYKHFINPNFDPQLLPTSVPTTTSKCPFAHKFVKSSIPPFAISKISNIHYTQIQNVHISDMNLPNLTVNLVDAEIKIFLGGKHDNITFGTQNQSIFLISDAASFANSEFKFISPSASTTKFPPELVQSILNAKPILTPSDVFYLISPVSSSKIVIINQEDIDKILNIIIYLKLSASPVDVEILKAPNIQPSSIEPYEDVLTLEYLKEIPNIFS